MKRLYTFVITKDEVGEEPEVSVNDAGEKVTVMKKVTKKIRHNFFIRRPTRQMWDDAEMFYAVNLSVGIKAGLLTRALLTKRFSNDGGVLSDEDKKAVQEAYGKLLETENEYKHLTAKKEEERTDADKKRLEELPKEVAGISEQIREFELNQMSLFDNTAEHRARTKTIVWWALQLAYAQKEDGKEEPFFGEGTFEQKIAKYDEIAEDETRVFENEIARKFLYYISFWYVGRANSEEDFVKLAQTFEPAEVSAQTP